MKFVLLFIAISFLLIVHPSRVGAATPLTNGIIVSPALEQINLNQGQTSSSFTTQITNNTSNDMAIHISAQDFTSLNQNGGISFLPSAASAHGLANSIVIGSTELKLAPNQSTTVPFTIQNTNALSTGGHYAAIIYKLLGPDLVPYNTVTINQSVTTLVFLKTYGQGTQTLRFTSEDVSPYMSTFPQTVNTIFANTGNTQTAVRGIVQLLSPSSKLVSQGIINIDSGLILPDSKRLFEVTLQRQDTSYLWPGMYHVKILFRHDSQSTYTVYDQAFLYISWQQLLIVATICIVIIGIFIVCSRKMWRKHRRPRFTKVAN